MTTKSAAALVAGFTNYAAAPELGEVAETAPAATPAILSWIGMSSTACGAAVSAVSSGGVTATVVWGC